jgi:hypothetical protein
LVRGGSSFNFDVLGIGRCCSFKGRDDFFRAELFDSGKDLRIKWMG